MTTGQSAISMGAPLWLWGLLALPVLAGLFLWAEHHAHRRLERLIQNPKLRRQLTGAASVGRRRLRYVLLLAGLAGLTVAMAEPRKGYEMRETHRRGLDLILAVDVSKSMLATDVLPDRLRRAKLSVQDLVGELGGDRLGLVAFAGSAFLQAPLTVDYDAVLDASAELDTALIPLGGTNIGAAIDLALDAFGKTDAGNRAIVLFSDGEPTSDTEQASGVQAATRAAAAGVKIFTVGIGTLDGSLIPLNGNGTEFVKDGDGKIVRSRLDENNLREVAKAGNGFYVCFTTGEETMRAVVSQGLNQMKTGEIDARPDRRPIERYQWPLGAGLIFLGWAALTGERRKAVAPVAEPKKNRAATRSGTASPPSAQAAVILSVALLLTTFVSASKATEPPSPPQNAPGALDGNALELYRGGHYDDAYQEFEELAKKNPGAGGLQFNAGASAYMGKQYDEALDAFGRALTTNDADLQAKSHYNFGNTLFRRGEEQKDREAKIKDWKNAIQHYDRTLATLKASGKESPLAANTAYNRDLVQKRLDEETKQPPPPPKQQKQPQQKQDQKDPKDQQQQQNQSQDQQQGQQNKDQQQGGQDQKNGQPPTQQSPPPPQSSAKTGNKILPPINPPNPPISPLIPRHFPSRINRVNTVISSLTRMELRTPRTPPPNPTKSPVK